LTRIAHFDCPEIRTGSRETVGRVSIYQPLAAIALNWTAPPTRHLWKAMLAVLAGGSLLTSNFPLRLWNRHARGLHG